MADYAVIEDWQAVEGEYVLDVTIRKTEDDKYPSGWDYSLHLGEVGGDTVLRYDNPTNERRATTTNVTRVAGSNTSSSPACSNSTTGSRGRSNR